MPYQQEFNRGLFFALSAFLLWGLAPVYFKAVEHVSPVEVLAHRIVWSVVILFCVLSWRKQWSELRSLSWSSFRPFLISSLLVSSNWFIFIWAVGQDRVLETSLGYFINPLFSLVLGMIFLAERLRKVQTIAVLLAVAGVVNQVFIVGTIPLVALALAVTFGFYSLMRKQIIIAPAVGLFLETIILAPLALLYLVWLSHEQTLAFGSLDWQTDLLLVCAGFMTTIPLLFFVAGAQRLSLAVLGITQYIAPSMTFFLAIFLYQEPFDIRQFITFGCIWAGLILFTAEGIRHNRKTKSSLL